MLVHYVFEGQADLKVFCILYYDQQMNNYYTNYHTAA